MRECQSWLFGFIGSDAESDASVQRDGFKLDVEAVAVGVSRSWGPPENRHYFLA